MRRRILLAAAPALVAATPLFFATAQAADDWHRRRDRHRSGLLLKDVEGEAQLDRWRRDGEFEGDILVQRFGYRRKLAVAGIIDGDAEFDGRRGRFEVDVGPARFFAGADLDLSRRHGLSLDIGEIDLDTISIDPDSVSLDRIYGPAADDLQDLLKQLAEALEDSDHDWWRRDRHERRRHHDDDEVDIDELIDAINDLLDKFLFVVDAGRHHR